MKGESKHPQVSPWSQFSLLLTGNFSEGRDGKKLFFKGTFFSGRLGLFKIRLTISSLNIIVSYVSRLLSSEGEGSACYIQV